MQHLWLFASVLVASAILTGLVRRVSQRSGLIDRPNARSSHSRPVPRGGGAAIVVTFLAALSLLAGEGTIGWPLAFALIAGGGIIAATGLVDDMRSLDAAPRLVLHFVGAGIALYAIGGMPPVSFGGQPVDLGLPGDVLAWIAVVWMLNLFNFMDGIDGIAGVEVVTVSLCAALLLMMRTNAGAALPGVALAAAATGFLIWNLPRARIFMGDVGSGFVGLAVAVLALGWSALNPAMFWAMLILCGAFIVDATYTLLARLAQGHAPHIAHRTHTYQIAARRFAGHLPVTLSVAVINIVWLLPLAWAVVDGFLAGPFALLAAYAPLIALAVWFGAGRPDSQKQQDHSDNARHEETDASH
ncbi:MraY family glycosyltransferase [Pararhizobium haloflavum]|uniref:MraY family glycosyltransferase n=1 Tax=Pararhizobium haloflavum TaxID=2037914 RepID=UPI000C177CDB|nr:glycosyltransferase family 4 protein [Pararhizobium haloflavum]